MSLYTTKQLTTKEAEEYNNEQRKIRSEIGSGCVTCWACNFCGIIVCDTICLCSASFTCPKCGKFNGIRASKIFKSLDILIHDRNAKSFDEDYNI